MSSQSQTGPAELLGHSSDSNMAITNPGGLPSHPHEQQAYPVPHHQPTRRHQEYQQQYHAHAALRSPAPRTAHPYPGMYNMNVQPQYYNQYPHMAYTSQRWPYHTPYPAYPHMHLQQQQMQQQPQHYPMSPVPQHHPQTSYQRQPMIVSSQVMNAPARSFMPSSASYSSSQSTPRMTDSPAQNKICPAASTSDHAPPQPSSPALTEPPLQAASDSPPQSPVSYTKTPFYPHLPWYYPAGCETSFPKRAARPRRRRSSKLRDTDKAITFPSRVQPSEGDADLESRAREGFAPAIADAISLPDGIGHSRTAEGPQPVDFTSNAPGQSNSQRQDHIVPAIPTTAILHQSSKGGDDDTATPSELEISHEPDPKLELATAPPAPPKSWAELVRSKGTATAALPMPNGSTATDGIHNQPKSSMADALDSFRVGVLDRIPFLKPHGLVNTGNMCYMNSILQVLVFCTPFYAFLDRTGKHAAHSFNSETPLIDAMIMFMREFEVIDSADSAEKLRLRLKSAELEQYGNAFTPEYVYDAIKRLPRFSTMRRGHQQDAEEFLGFLLAGLHDECATIQQKKSMPSQASADPHGSLDDVSDVSNSDGWLEVGPKQRAAITRQSGDTATTTPITRVFGGTLRSELRVPGNKISITMEPYQPLQLDIGAADVRNIQEALTGLTKPESLTGAFSSPRGTGTTATKQVFIETLPPVLILHLKRFQYDSYGGTQKIWKKIGYPLELEIPKAVFSTSKRSTFTAKGTLPRYRLTAVVYHHGKSAAGGHYTVDLLRQDRREWIRVDDTAIRRVRPEDVAEGGAEEDLAVLVKAAHEHRSDNEPNNIFDAIDNEREEFGGASGEQWNQVNGTEVKKRWAKVAGSISATGGGEDVRKSGSKDNKVAYILLYEKMS